MLSYIIAFSAVLALAQTGHIHDARYPGALNPASLPYLGQTTHIRYGRLPHGSIAHRSYGASPFTGQLSPLSPALGLNHGGHIGHAVVGLGNPLAAGGAISHTYVNKVVPLENSAHLAHVNALSHRHPLDHISQTAPLAHVGRLGAGAAGLSRITPYGSNALAYSGQLPHSYVSRTDIRPHVAAPVAHAAPLVHASPLAHVASLAHTAPLAHSAPLALAASLGHTAHLPHAAHLAQAGHLGLGQIRPYAHSGLLSQAAHIPQIPPHVSDPLAHGAPLAGAVPQVPLGIASGLQHPYGNGLTGGLAGYPAGGIYGGYAGRYANNYNFPQYQFGYSVEDPRTGDHKAQHEERNGDVVRGEYSLVQPDGSVRKVSYSADDHSGFHAVVQNSSPNHHTYSSHHHH